MAQAQEPQVIQEDNVCDNVLLLSYGRFHWKALVWNTQKNVVLNISTAAQHS